MRRLAFLLLLAALPASAATYHVDGSCASSGNGSAAGCTSSGGQAFKTVSECMAAMSAGDTCKIAATATYVGRFNFCGQSSRNLSGTDSSHYTVFTGETSTKPKFCRDAGCVAYGALVGAGASPAGPDPVATVGNYNFVAAPTAPSGAPANGDSMDCSYIKLDGLELHGQLVIWNDYTTRSVHHITVTNSDLSGNGGCDGNNSVVRIENNPKTFVSGTTSRVHDIQFDHNYVHDLMRCQGTCSGGTNAGATCLDSSVTCTGGGTCSNQGGFGGYSFIKMFNVSDSIFEYDTLDGNGCTSPGYNGGTTCERGSACCGTSNGQFDDKDCPLRNTLRYSYLVNGSNGDVIRLNNQCNESTHTVGGEQIYGNVLLRNGISFLLPKSPEIAWSIDHNTIVNPSQGGNAGLWTSITDTTGDSNITFTNNVVDDPSLNVRIQAQSWTQRGTDVFDYNRYDSDAVYVGNGFSTGGSCDVSPKYCSIGTWQSASGLDIHSTEAATPCSYASGSDTAYHITAATACKTLSSSGGEVGAYGASGATGCVGYTCAATSLTPTTVRDVTLKGATIR